MFSPKFAYTNLPCKINIIHVQWRSQKADKITHIKGRILYQAVILFNYVSFQNGNFSLAVHYKLEMNILHIFYKYVLYILHLY